ncbi:MAG TPA: T9SS type A sorting domain-containing protein [Cytophagaceae bacterium]|nr:T9SS type A sorting domain-containing protein [Cytophagaceae bacterium]
MKKIVFVLLALAVFTKTHAVSYFSVQSPTPKYGCPNTTQDVTIGFTNLTPFSIPANSYSYTVTFYHSDLTTSFYSYTPSSTPAIGSSSSGNNTVTVLLQDVPFTVAEVCSVAVHLTYTSPSSGTYDTNVDYTVQNPPTLTIEDTTTGTLDVQNASTQLSTVYKAIYYKDANYTSAVDTSDDGLYTPAASGSYTAMAYEPSSGCISVTASNAVNITVTSVTTKDAQKINVSVYPNPMAASVTISTGLPDLMRYELADMNGNIVRKGEFSSVTNLNVETLKQGSYLLTVKDQQSNTASYKLVK